MSRPEDRRQFAITEGPTALVVSEEQTRIQHAGGILIFNGIPDFMEFVNRIGILAVRLDAFLTPGPGDDGNTEGSEEPPA